MATAILSLAVSLLLMISGFVVQLFDRENEAVMWFLGIGAGLGLVAFFGFCLMAIGYVMVQLVDLRGS